MLQHLQKQKTGPAGFTISAVQQPCRCVAAGRQRPADAAPGRGQAGFTIIEVLVVLAIAGLIMVVVFLAVPALQRSGRNNALNADARTILAAAGNFLSNNGGTQPAAMSATAPSSGLITIGTTSTNQEAARVDNVVVTVQIDTGTSPITNSSAIGTFEIVTGTKAVCDSTNTGLSGTGSARSQVILYVAESGSGNILKCFGN